MYSYCSSTSKKHSFMVRVSDVMESFLKSRILRSINAFTAILEITTVLRVLTTTTTTNMSKTKSYKSTRLIVPECFLLSN